MSEPCAHEREFAGTQQDTLTSFIKTSGELVKVTAERDAARATIAKVRALAESWGGFGDKSGFRSTMVFAAKELHAALKPTDLPKGKP